MVPIRLWLPERDDDPIMYDIAKNPLPRVGDRLSFRGTRYAVTEVEHVLKEGRGITAVDVYVEIYAGVFV